MKRIFILAAIALLVTGALFAEEATLIDFAKLTADIIPDQATNTPTQNRATMMDFSTNAGNSFTAEQKSVMKTSLAITNWLVELASSSQNVTNKSLSFTREAASKQFEKVLGIRVHFPVEPFQSWAKIKPPFEIPAYEPQADVADDGAISAKADGGNGVTGPSRFEDGFGVVKNVGTIKQLAVNVYGLQFPYSLSVILIDNTGKEHIMSLGAINFDGWGELTWNNPQYVQDVRSRDLRIYPLYPESSPFVKFGGFLVQRDAAQVGGDFVAYFKDVRVIYDKAVLDTDRDIDDESTWNIITDRERAKQKFEMSNFGQNQVLQYLDKQKQAVELPFEDPNRQQQQAANP